jgi:hypothetical protein
MQAIRVSPWSVTLRAALREYQRNISMGRMQKLLRFSQSKMPAQNFDCFDAKIRETD